MKLNQKKLNLRPTPIRTAILEILKKSKHPMTVSELVTETDKHSVKPNQATVYRVLEVLVKHGLVKQIDFKEGKYRYEVEGDHHHHLVCTKCGHIEPIHEACISVSSEFILQTYEFRVTEHQLEFFGLCKNCQQSSEGIA
jgi:Fur family ferric uptake transcriptional regulator